MSTTEPPSGKRSSASLQPRKWLRRLIASTRSQSATLVPPKPIPPPTPTFITRPSRPPTPAVASSNTRVRSASSAASPTAVTAEPPSPSTSSAVARALSPFMSATATAAPSRARCCELPATSADGGRLRLGCSGDARGCGKARRPRLELDQGNVDHAREQPVPARDDHELEQLVIAQPPGERCPQLIGDGVAVVQRVGSRDQLRIVRRPRCIVGRPVDRRSELALGEAERAAECDRMNAPLVLCAGPRAGSQYQQLALAWLEPGMAEDAGPERPHARGQ